MADLLQGEYGAYGNTAASRVTTPPPTGPYGAGTRVGGGPVNQGKDWTTFTKEPKAGPYGPGSKIGGGPVNNQNAYGYSQPARQGPYGPGSQFGGGPVNNLQATAYQVPRSGPYGTGSQYGAGPVRNLQSTGYTTPKPTPPQPTATKRTFGFGLTERVQRNAPLIPDSALQTPGGRFASIGRSAIVSGASFLDLLGEGGKDIMKGDFNSLGALTWEAAYGATFGTAEQLGSAGGSLVSGDIGGASQKLSTLGAGLAVGQSFFSFGKGFTSQGFNVGKAGFNPKTFAERYGPTDAMGFAKEPLAGARAKAQLEPFRSAPSFSALREQAAVRQARPIAISLTPPVGKVTATPLFTSKGVVFEVGLKQFTGMFEKSKFPVKTTPLVTSTGIFPSVGKRELEGKFSKSEFQETKQYTPRGVETVTVKKLDLSQPGKPPAAKLLQKPSDTDPFNVGAVRNSPSTVSVRPESMMERQERRYSDPLFIEKPEAVRISTPYPVNMQGFKQTSETTVFTRSFDATRVASLTGPANKTSLVSKPTEQSRIVDKTQEVTRNRTDNVAFTTTSSASSTRAADLVIPKFKPIEAQRYAEAPRYREGNPFASSSIPLAGRQEKQEKKKGISLWEQGYEVLFKKEGIWKTVPGFFTQGEAISIGNLAVRGGAQRTFKIRPEGIARPGRISRNLGARELYTPKTIKAGAGERVFTQKPRFSIRTAAEKAQITFKGIAARRRGRRWF